MDPLGCSRSRGTMRLVTYLEQPAGSEQILTHLDVWPVSAHSPPVAGDPLPPSLQRVVAAERVRLPVRRDPVRGGTATGPRFRVSTRSWKPGPPATVNQREVWPPGWSSRGQKVPSSRG
jgi:hypothetical protein